METNEEFGKYKSKIMEEYMAPFEMNSISEGIKIDLDGKLLNAINVRNLSLEESIGISQDIYNIAKTYGIEEFSLKNIHISSNQELPEMLKEVGKNTKKIKIENCEIGNLEHLMQGISGKETKENIFLRAKLGITKFEYNKPENKMRIAADRTSLIKDFYEYIEPENVDILLRKEEDKIKLAQNINEIREIKAKKIRVKDDTYKKEITGIDKYEQYVNGGIVLLHSKILKESLGIDRLPTKQRVSSGFHLNIDGQKLVENERYKLEGNEFRAFIHDLKELAHYSNIVRISFKNVELPNDERFKDVALKIFEQVHWIIVEDSKIPELATLIVRISDKQELEKLVIRNSEVKLEDLGNIQEFSNLSYISVGDGAEQLMSIGKQDEWLVDGENNKNIWHIVKKLFRNLIRKSKFFSENKI
ncbi:MAG: hypothetical protein FWF46_08845 [Oscillospiraceae bacterium]|nr:hypothetical protein [Oscillospiraceae bacterium]